MDVSLDALPVVIGHVLPNYVKSSAYILEIIDLTTCWDHQWETQPLTARTLYACYACAMVTRQSRSSTKWFTFFIFFWESNSGLKSSLLSINHLMKQGIEKVLHQAFLAPPYHKRLIGRESKKNPQVHIAIKVKCDALPLIPPKSRSSSSFVFHGNLEKEQILEYHNTFPEARGRYCISILINWIRFMCVSHTHIQ